MILIQNGRGEFLGFLAALAWIVFFVGALVMAWRHRDNEKEPPSCPMSDEFFKDLEKRNEKSKVEKFKG